MKSSKNSLIKGLSLIIIMTVIPLIFVAQPTLFNNNDRKRFEETQVESISTLKSSLPASDYEWWNKSWTFEITNGVYEFRYSTANIDAFMFPQTLDETSITIEKENYEDLTIEITIVVGMTEIFPGFPMFYFLLLIIGIIAVVGSLVAYRQIQRARIPTFVKKVREMKSTIKSRKSISESLLYPSKESYTVKLLGDKWETLGLSLEDILGIETKKGKKTLEKSKNEGGIM